MGARRLDAVSRFRPRGQSNPSARPVWPDHINRSRPVLSTESQGVVASVLLGVRRAPGSECFIYSRGVGSTPRVAVGALAYLSMRIPMPLRRPATTLAESALTLLARTAGDFRLSYGLALVRSAGRIRRTVTALGSYDLRAVTAESSFLRLVTIAEAFTDSLSVSLLRGRAQPEPQLMGLVNQYELRAGPTWEARRESYERIHGVRFGACPHWASLKIGTEIRNAIAHGLGTLTVRQRAELAKWQRGFPKVSVGLDGYRLEVTPDSIQECMRYASGFVRWLDASAT
jgi:hypothetical protein